MTAPRRAPPQLIDVTDHALVRFLDRAVGFDVEALRAMIATSLARAATKAGSIAQDRYEVRADGLRYVVRDGALVTILPLQAARRRSEAVDE